MRRHLIAHPPFFPPLFLQQHFPLRKSTRKQAGSRTHTPETTPPVFIRRRGTTAPNSLCVGFPTQTTPPPTESEVQQRPSGPGRDTLNRTQRTTASALKASPRSHHTQQGQDRSMLQSPHINSRPAANARSMFANSARPPRARRRRDASPQPRTASGAQCTHSPLRPLFGATLHSSHIYIHI